MAETDALDRLLVVAQSEGALGPERLADFALGLRERARLVLEDRVRPLEQRIQALDAAAAALQKENAWRRETTTALEAQVAWLRQQGESLRAEMERMRSEAENLRGELDGIRREAGSLRAAHEQAAAALRESQAVHDRLLAHHRDMVGQAVRHFAGAAALPFWRFRTCRSRLTEAAAQFARELA